MVNVSIEKLPAYVHHYVHRVIGLNVTLTDSSQPCMIKSKKPEIQLPMTPESLGAFLGEEFAEHAPVELVFAIVIGLAYHEAAHLLSGEKNTRPHLLNNIICDSNDFNTVPTRWKGSMPFTISLMNTTYKRATDLVELPLGTRENQLQALLHMAITYLRKLRIKDNGKDVRSLAADHPLTPYFERIKSIMRTARKALVKERPRLVKQLYKILEEFWDNTKGQGNGQLLEEALQDRQAEVIVILTGQDARDLGKKLKKAGRLQKITGELKRTAVIVAILEAKEEQQKSAEALTRINEHPEHDTTLNLEEKPTTASPVPINQGIARQLRRALQPLLFERALARRKPSITGIRFAPARFHEIKTNPEAPRIRKDVLRTGRATIETLFILCFDRSGSMGGDKEQVCKEIAGTFYQALQTIPQARFVLLGFDDHVNVIIDSKHGSLQDNLARISNGLTARGGTNFPLGLYHSLRQAERHPGHRKVVIMLTDGAIHGQFSLEDLLLYARHLHTEVLTIGVHGSDKEQLKAQLGRHSVVYVEETQKLPEEIKRLATRLA